MLLEIAPRDRTISGHIANLLERYLTVRRFSEELCKPLVVEDYVVQSMPEVSPTKWHLAHTSWFFETFLLTPYLSNYQPFDARFSYLFNSYYNAIGDRHCRQNRGLLSRPTVQEIYDYRNHVDIHITSLLEGADAGLISNIDPLMAIGIHHEQQHQELMLTDIKHVFWVNPLRPAYLEKHQTESPNIAVSGWTRLAPGLIEVGHQGPGFAFDNEGPRHQVFVSQFELATRLVTNGEFKDFIDDGGYRRPELWLSMGWASAKSEGWNAPLYWFEDGASWLNFSLSGLRPVENDEPVCHLSYLEADAFARWKGARLPTEFEWEAAAATLPTFDGAFVELRSFHPGIARDKKGLQQMFGELWQWTSSSYAPYPGYRPAEGALGEYNGKFMCNQYVLRGGSVATSRTHMRRTYRNFFPPATRWQFSGLRLARDV